MNSTADADALIAWAFAVTLFCLAIIGRRMQIHVRLRTKTIVGPQMEITSRYSDIPEVKIDRNNVPEQFRHLIPLAIEWCIGDDLERDKYMATASEEKKRALADAFAPHFDGLWNWHQDLAHLSPQPDELVLFDMAAEAAAEVISELGSR